MLLYINVVLLINVQNNLNYASPSNIREVIKFLACVTEQTHDIRVYGLCDDARFSVP